MDDDEWVGWTERNDHRYTVPSPCSDCLHGFALDMRAAGRCDGVPMGYECDDDFRNYMPDNQRRSAEVRARRKAERAAMAQALYRSGLGNVEIAREMGLAESTVNDYIRELVA